MTPKMLMASSIESCKPNVSGCLFMSVLAGGVTYTLATDIGLHEFGVPNRCSTISIRLETQMGR